MTAVDAAQIRRALHSRLVEAATVLLPDFTAPDSGEPSHDSAILLDALVADIRDRPSRDRLWLLYVTVATVFPTTDTLNKLARHFELVNQAEATTLLLNAAFADARAHGSPGSTMKIVSNAAVIDVDFAARHNLHTGIQRVVRSTVPRWAEQRPVAIAAWTSTHAAYREVSDTERDRVVSWGDHRVETKTKSPNLPPRLIVPWRTAVVLAEVPARPACDRLLALGEYSGNELAAIGYDCIPIVSADLLPAAEANRFVRYLSVLKHAHGVAGISVSATEEFGGFASMLQAQGLAGPAVFECALPSPTPDAQLHQVPSGRPQLACVGSFEPRKNQLAVLHAAEVLWKEGLQFELLFIGGGGAFSEVRRTVAALAKRGRPVETRTGISEAELASIYRGCRFTIFNSLHEGYGLPIAESLSHGTPVVTTDYGSTKEIAAGGGAVLVNPRDDRQLTDAMRELLTDDDRLDELREQIRLRPNRTWQQYADELWEFLAEPAIKSASQPATGGGGR
jgi:glycosyltransferase involved in cell wall biosynthesis